MRTLLALLLLGGTAVAAPVVLRQSIDLQAVSMHESEDWVPMLGFMLQGDVPEGQALVVEYTRPDGKPWGKIELPLNRADDNNVREARETMLDPAGSIKDVGVVKLAIKLGDATLFSGQFEVKKQPGTGKSIAYYVDNDWLLGLAQLQLLVNQHEDNPNLGATMWFKNTDCSYVEAALFFDGKQLATTHDTDTADKGRRDVRRATGDPDALRYTQCWFEFKLVKGYVNGDYGDQAKAWHDMSKKPGKYEIKVGERTLAFTVDKNGMIARPGPVEAGHKNFVMAVGDVKSIFGGAPGADAKIPETVYGSWKKRPKK
jgi:hypothetical protein